VSARGDVLMLAIVPTPLVIWVNQRKRAAQHGTEQACAASNSEGLSGHLSLLLKFIVFHCFSHSLDLPFIYLMAKPLEMKGHCSPRESHKAPRTPKSDRPCLTVSSNTPWGFLP